MIQICMPYSPCLEKASLNEATTNQLEKFRSLKRSKLFVPDTSIKSFWAKLLLTYLHMELSPSWEAANCAATQELLSILRKPKVHYRVHKSPPLVPILSQIDPPIPSHRISLRSIFIWKSSSFKMEATCSSETPKSVRNNKRTNLKGKISFVRNVGNRLYCHRVMGLHHTIKIYLILAD
jgi:hypothetical protein